jgi:threonine/homoserine/homoserine lactone efflux protein
MGALALEQGLKQKQGHTATTGDVAQKGSANRFGAALGTGLGAALGMGGWGFVGVVLVSRAGPFIEQYEKPLQMLVAGLFLFIAFSGWRGLRHKRVDTSELNLFTPAFAKASLISALRPTTALIVAGLLSSFFAGQPVEHPVAFAFAAFLANFAWFLVLIALAKVILAKFSARAVVWVRQALVAIIGIFGCALLVRALV